MELRVRQPELMDARELAEAPHRQALRGLTRVNRISSTASVLWAAMRPFASPGRSLRVLDVGCGAGDVLMSVACRAARQDVSFHGVGCDVSATAIKHARQRAQTTPADVRQSLRLEFLPLDCLRGALPGEFDIVMCSLFLHHLSDEEAQTLLGRLRPAARKAILVDDLRRSRLGYALAWIGTRLLSRSRIVHVDGPLSVKAAFTAAELHSLAARAGLERSMITHHWPCRMLLKWIRE